MRYKGNPSGRKVHPIWVTWQGNYIKSQCMETKNATKGNGRLSVKGLMSHLLSPSSRWCHMNALFVLTQTRMDPLNQSLKPFPLLSPLSVPPSSASYSLPLNCYAAEPPVAACQTCWMRRHRHKPDIDPSPLVLVIGQFLPPRTPHSFYFCFFFGRNIFYL